MASAPPDCAQGSEQELQGRLLARFVDDDEVLLAVPSRPSLRAPLPSRLKGHVSPGDPVLVAIEGERVVSWRPLGERAQS